MRSNIPNSPETETSDGEKRPLEETSGSSGVLGVQGQTERTREEYQFSDPGLALLNRIRNTSLKELVDEATKILRGKAAQKSPGPRQPTQSLSGLFTLGGLEAPFDYRTEILGDEWLHQDRLGHLANLYGIGLPTTPEKRRERFFVVPGGRDDSDK